MASYSATLMDDDETVGGLHIRNYGDVNLMEGDEAATLHFEDAGGAVELNVNAADVGIWIARLQELESALLQNEELMAPQDEED